MNQTEYDNTWNGALFPTTEPGLLAGPITLPGDRKARAVLERNGVSHKLHKMSVYRIKRDGSLGAVLYEGIVRKSGGNGPIGKGILSSGKKTVHICLWLKHDLADMYYQVKPDKLNEHIAKTFEL